MSTIRGDYVAELVRKMVKENSQETIIDGCKVRTFTAGARIFANELLKKELKGDISYDEYIFGFGIICDWALTDAGKDFYR